MFGLLKLVVVVLVEFEGVFFEGIGFDGFVIEGLVWVYEVDMFVWLDLFMFVVLFWCGDYYGMVRMFCDVFILDGELLLFDLCNVFCCVL